MTETEPYDHSSWIPIKKENRGECRDIIFVIPGVDAPTNQISCSEFFVRVPFLHNYHSSETIVSVHINGHKIEAMNMFFEENGRCRFVNACEGSPYRPSAEILEMLGGRGKNHNQSFILDPNQNNRMSFVIPSKDITLECIMYVWSSSDSVIVCDIDGTITASNIKGMLDPSHVHRGVCRFFSNILESSDGFYVSSRSVDSTPSDSSFFCSKVRLVYLTSRPLATLHMTRKLLSGLQQKDSKLNLSMLTSTRMGEVTPHDASLPPGPIFCQEYGLFRALYSETIKKDVHEIKSAALRNLIVNPFQIAGRPNVSN